MKVRMTFTYIYDLPDTSIAVPQKRIETEMQLARPVIGNALLCGAGRICGEIVSDCDVILAEKTEGRAE
jgi:hypothetical protein